MKGLIPAFGSIWSMLLVIALQGQAPLQLDTSFRLTFNDKGVADILPMTDGGLLISGQLRQEGDPDFRTLLKVDQFGNLITSFPGSQNTAGGGQMTTWNDKIYVATAHIVRRLDAEGFFDPSFIQMNAGPYFSSLQGGDYHVFPDGRVLLTGAHDLQDPVRGFDGLYNLIWFSNTGYLDTSRTHRRSNGTTNTIKHLPNEQFLVCGTGSLYEDQPVGRIFRINEDGSLDPALQTGVNWGAAYSFLPLPDGRFYAGGIFRRAVFPEDTLRLVRFLPNGELDPSFDNHLSFDNGALPYYNVGPGVGKIQPWTNGSILVMGRFQFIDGEPRNGICVIDSTGQLTDQFDECGVGPYTYQNIVSASVNGVVEAPGDKLYVYGVYNGYNDGTTNDTLQRFVTRLYGPDFTTSVQEESPQDAFTFYPNPTHGTVELRMAHPPAGTARVRVYDPSGRQVLERSVSNAATQLDVAPLANGIYLVEVEDGGQRLGAIRLAVQH
ncbi:MAG: T9SS type A sorting domain-containing protein [Flavobacteriales bacterium]|nr:T9SS type A sorting domain-containing protein [Flavobacteriales bacterium]